MIERQLADITKPDIDALIENEVGESRTLEYKQTLPGSSESEKKEFLADISSFANSTGGDIIYGIAEKKDSEGKNTGTPAALGIKGLNEDQEVRRLENMIRDGIAPRLAGVAMREVAGFAEGPCLVVRIPNSYAKPHIVTRGESRFYCRTSKGKYPLDVGEIRAAFAQSEELPRRIREFRMDRIARIAAGDTPMPMKDIPKLVFHVVPLASLDPSFRLDMRQIVKYSDSCLPMRTVNRTGEYNFDGRLIKSDWASDKFRGGYVQIFRNAAIEVVDGTMMDAGLHSSSCLPSQGYEEETIKAFRGCLDFYQNTGIAAPFATMLTFQGVKGIKMAVNERVITYYSARSEFDRDIVALPEIILNEVPENVEQGLRPLFDMAWQATGWPESQNYDENGRWVGQKR